MISSFYPPISGQATSPLNENIINIVEDEDDTQELENNIQLLNHFIEQLDKLNRALLLLYLDNHSYKEISEILGITETNVATKINRIKHKLKKQFAQQQTS